MNTRHLICTIALLLIGGHTLFAQYETYELSLLEFVASGESSISTKEEMAKAQYELGLRYYDGKKGVSKDITRCLYWMSKAGENSLTSAQLFLASVYYDGDYVPQNYNKALYWFKKAADQNDHTGSLYAGKMYLYGMGCDEDEAKAASYFKDAAFGEIPEGMCYYSYCFANGTGVKTDTVKAVFWGERAINKGDYRACGVLGKMYTEGNSYNDKCLSYSYLKEGSHNGDYFSSYLLGKSYFDGSLIKGKDIKRGMEILTELADKNYLRAMKEVARLYISKDSGVYNMTDATMWYQRLVDEGELDYARPLIEIYEGNGNYLAAASVYQVLLTKGENVDVLKNLADYFANGKGVSQNYEEALSYIDRAIEIAPNDMTLLDIKREILLGKGDVKSAKKLF